MKPRFIVEQAITAFVNKYRVYNVTEQGEKTQLVGLAQQKRIALKEKVSFYGDEQKTQLAFSFRAEKVMDIHGRYLVEDTNGVVVGAFKKLFKQSLISSTWQILDAQDNAVLEVTESNKTLAIMRRYATLIPIAGEVFDLVLAFFKFHFVFRVPGTEEIVGKYQKQTLFRDHYMLSMTDDAFAQVDWRTLAAMGVALDALQAR